MAVVEHALLPVSPGREAAFEAAFAEAKPLIVQSPGFLGMDLRREAGNGSRYLLIAHWRSVEDHRDGFRQSARYAQWRTLLHHFYDPMPAVLYFGPPLG